MNSMQAEDPELSGGEAPEVGANVGGDGIGRPGSILRGIGLLTVGHIAACSAASAIGAIFWSADLGFAWFLFLGVTQAAHVVPLIAWLNARREHRTAKGVWIGVGITALLNAACFGIGIATFSRL